MSVSPFRYCLSGEPNRAITGTRAENVVAFCGLDFSSADYIFLQYKMCMMNNNNTQFNLLYIATKTSKSDPQSATTFSALVPVTVYLSVETGLVW